MGTESNGGFVNISISNCAISSSPDSPRKLHKGGRGLAGIALEMVDGGRLDRVTISNIAIRGVNVPIFMRLGDRGRPYKKDMLRPPVGSFKNVTVSNVIATEVSPIGCSITGLPGHPIENVTLSNINLSFDGGEEKALAARAVAELPEQYPESGMFGKLPAYGLFCRHVKGLTLSNVALRTAKPDLRHALVCDDVQDLAIENLDAKYWPGAATLLRLTGVRGALIRGCRPQVSGGAFLKLEGSETSNIVLTGNDLSGVGNVADVAGDVAKTALVQK
ncbi:hypothetical protein FJY63_08700 [Candidatus Sumerlaeota bacterium]|nr:hypothetical protein [Candidatus Sumerlaeota bacterium]